MTMELPTEAQCKRASSLFNEVLDPAHRYAERKRLTARPFASYFEARELWEGFPKNWEENALGMLAAGAVFTRPDRVAAFLRSMGDTLPDAVVAMVRAWRARPWVWAFCQVVEDYGDRRLAVEPIGAPPSTWSGAERWSRMLIYSRSVADNYQRGSRLFFTQLVDAGPAFVTYGAIVPFMAFEQADVLFMADVVRSADRPPGSVPLLGMADRSMPVSDIAAANPIPFLAMLRFSETPPVRTPQGPPGRFASAVVLSEAANPWSENRWREAAEMAGERVSAVVIDDVGGGIVFGDGSPMYDPGVYIHRENRRAYLEARTRAGYDRGRATAAGIVDFPEEPDVVTGIVAVAAAARIVGMDETLSDECGVLRARYEEAIREAAPPPEPAGDEDGESLPSSVEELQAIADRLIHNHNEGIREETGTTAADLGVDPAVVDYVRRRLEASFSRMDYTSADEVGTDPFGLSPRAFAELTRAGAPDVAGVFRLRDADELRGVWNLIAAAPYQRAVRWLLDRAMSAEGLPATQAGYISPSVVAQARREGIAGWFGDIDPKKEADWPALRRIRNLAESAHLLRLSENTFTPTDAALRLVDDPAGLYRHLLATAFGTVEWAGTSRIGPTPQLHRMAGFLFYAAGELCDARREDDTTKGDGTEAAWTPMRMLADRFVAAVRPLARAVHERSSGEDAGERRLFGVEDWARAVVDVIFVDQMGVQFGLFEHSGELDEEAQFRTTPLYEAVFERPRR